MIRHSATVLLALLSACTTAHGAPPALEGSKWRFVTIDGQRPKADGAKLEFPSGRIAAWVGCNGLGGDLRITDGKLGTSGIVSTMMYCDGMMEQEHAVSELLGASPRYTIANGRLLLEGGGHQAELRPSD